jgi:hypothetical protein
MAGKTMTKPPGKSAPRKAPTPAAKPATVKRAPRVPDVVGDIAAMVEKARAGGPTAEARKKVDDLADRMAYIHLLGGFPTHLRPDSYALLRQVTTEAQDDSRPGPFRLLPEVVALLKLDDHPMVTKARELMARGYDLARTRGTEDRRPYGRVWLWKRLDETRAIHATVDNKGGLREGHQ